MAWLIAGAHSLHVEAFFCRQPDENHAEFYRFLLEHNARMYGVHFALDPVGDVYLVGRLPLAAISVSEVDRLLGCVLSYADDTFDQALMIGLRVRHQEGVRLAGQARREPGQPAGLWPADRRREGRARLGEGSASGLAVRSYGPDQPGHGLGRLLDLGLRVRPALLDGLGHAVAEMVLQQPDSDRLQRTGRCRYLGQHVDAVGVILDHPLQAADLALDTAQPLEVGILILGVSVHALTVHAVMAFRLPRQYRTKAAAKEGHHGPARPADRREGPRSGHAQNQPRPPPRRPRRPGEAGCVVSTSAVARDTFEVFGTTAVLLVTDPRTLVQARGIADELAADVDLACSRFRPDSELARLNAAGGKPIAISEMFADLLAAALRAAKLTGGDIDPTCGRALTGLGYDRDFADVKAAGDGAPRLTGSVGPLPGWGNVHLDSEGRRAWLDHGVQIDLARHSQGVGVRPVRGADGRPARLRRPRQPGRRCSGRRPAAAGQLADQGHR